MPIPPDLLTHARTMRKEQTNVEALLWSILRNRKFGGYKFRRQVPFGGYILDFFCDQCNLAIELDGGGHATPEQAEYDRVRSKALDGAGIKVLRFWNHEALRNIEAVLEAVWNALNER